MKIAFIGLGNMGGGMAANLVKAGHTVNAFDLSVEALARAQENGCATFTCVREAVDGVDAVVSMLPNGSIVDSVFENDVLGHAPKGAILLDCSTIDVDTARKVTADAVAAGYDMVDAPVSGGQAGAQNGVLSVMCGGAEAHYAAAEPVIAAYARICRRLGESGAGQLAKMMNQICIAGLMQGLSEALAFGQKAGLDGAAVVEVISQGAAGSWQMANRHKTMLEDRFDFGFAVDWMRKDLNITLNEARRNGAQLPVTALVDQFYSEVQALGGKRQDTSSLIRRLKRPNRG